MPTYSLNVVFTTEEEDPVVTCQQVANILNTIPDSVGVTESATLTADNGTIVDLTNVPVPRDDEPKPLIHVGAQSVAPPASGPQSVDPDNPPEHSLPTGKEF